MTFQIIMMILLIGYAIVVMGYLRFILSGLDVESSKNLSWTEKQLKEIQYRRNLVDEQRKVLSEEAAEIFTLYEITKDIGKTLNEDDAFIIFKNKLREHVLFTDCMILKEKDPEFAGYSNSRDSLVFQLGKSDDEMHYLVIKDISDDDKEKALILTHQFTLALRRVWLYQEIERVAITDSLTHVHTRRYTMERFQEELKRSTHKNLPLSYLMIDVDHFKRINDTYGHLTGDQVLRKLAKIIKAHVREIDIPGRYGGEEFCVILPDTDRDGALFVAERIRMETENTIIRAYDQKIHVTVSVGLATFPHDARKLSELIDKADYLLYRAKKDGRNRVYHLGEGGIKP